MNEDKVKKEIEESRELTLRVKQSIVVEDEQTALDAGEILKDTAAGLKEAEFRRKEITEPLLLAKRKIDKLFTDLKAPLKEREAYLKGQLLDFEARQAQARLEATKAADSAALEGADPMEMMKLLQDSVKAPVRAEGISIRKTWDVEVLDKAKVPLEFMKVDLVALKAHARKVQGQEEVPGIRMFLKENITARS